MDELYQAAQAALIALENAKEEVMYGVEAAQKMAGHPITDRILEQRVAVFKAHESAIEGLKRALSHCL